MITQIELYLTFKEYELKQAEVNILQELAFKYIQDGGIVTEDIKTKIKMIVSDFNRIKERHFFIKEQYIREQMSLLGFPSPGALPPLPSALPPLPSAPPPLSALPPLPSAPPPLSALPPLSAPPGLVPLRSAPPRRFLPLGNGTFGIYPYPLSYY
jgi:hypothetical protein